MELKELQCKKCKTPIKEEDFFDNMIVAKCSQCDTVFTVVESGTEKRIDKRRRKPVALPEKFETDIDKGNFIIRYKKSKQVVTFSVFFAIFWNTFMVVWNTISIAAGIWVMALFGSLHTAIGLGLIYFTLVSVFNKTTITVGSGLLDISSRPFPWKGNKSINAHDIDQIFVRQKFGSRKGAFYEVYAVNRKTGANMKLITDLPEYEQAAYIEYELETKLDIRDRKVPGETRNN